MPRSADDSRRFRHRRRARREKPAAKLRRSLGRREFLKVAGASAAAAALYPVLERTSAVRADQPRATRVLIEDLRLDAQALARGILTGLVASPQGIGVAPGRARGSYVSPILAAERRFTHVGLHWAGRAGDALSFEVRWSPDGTVWLDWEPVLTEAHAPEGANETFGALIRTGFATRVQFRTSFGDRGSRPLLRDATATLLNTSDGPTIEALESSGETPPVSGTVFKREDWGADEDLRLDADGSEIWPRMYVPVKKAVVHHTATSNSYSTVEEAIDEVKAIYTYHAVTLGWGDIGYNAIIDKWGNVYEGRHGRGEGASREPFSPGVVAGHATSHNYGSSGIALLGTYTQRGEGGRPGDPPSPDAYNSLVDVLAWECGRHDVKPQDAGDFLLYNDEWNRGLANIPGHRDCVSMICPGGNVYDLLPDIRADVEREVARSSPSTDLQAPAKDTEDVGAVSSLEFSWSSGELTSFLYLLEGWRRQAEGSEDIDYLSGFDADAYPVWLETTQQLARFGELFDAFSSLPEPVAGHYTFHVLAVDGSGNLGYQRDHTLLVTEDGGGNVAPSVEITRPEDGANFESGSAIELAGAASDPEDGDLSDSIEWTSSLDGLLGTGASISVVLGDGQHTIMATVVDSNGASAGATISITVGNGTSEPISLSATGYKVRGLHKADLEWSGATSMNVDIYRDGALITTTANDGFYTDDIDQRGSGSYVYRVCEAGSTSVCSNEATVSF